MSPEGSAVRDILFGIVVEGVVLAGAAVIVAKCCPSVRRLYRYAIQTRESALAQEAAREQEASQTNISNDP